MYWGVVPCATYAKKFEGRKKIERDRKCVWELQSLQTKFHFNAINWNKGYFVLVLQQLFRKGFLCSLKDPCYTCSYAIHPPSESVLVKCYFLCIVCCWNPACRAFLLANLLACAWSFASLVFRFQLLVCLHPQEKKGRKQTNYTKYQRCEQLRTF